MANNNIITMEAWMEKIDDAKFRKEDMNKLVMDFLVTDGWVDAAEKFNYESGTEQIDLATIMDRGAVRKAVECGNIEDAIEKINDLNPEILDENPQVLFHLQQQRFIESIRDGKIEEALVIAQEELAPIGEQYGCFLEELEITVALLGFEDPAESPAGALLNISQRQKVAREVNLTILMSQNDETDTALKCVLEMLIWAQIELAKIVKFPLVDFLTEELSEVIQWP